MSDESKARVIYGSDGVGGYEEKGLSDKPWRVDPTGDTIQPAQLQDRVVSGDITALNETVALDCEGCGVASFQITGTWEGTIVGEASIDGVNWFTLAGYLVPGDRAVATQTTQNGIFRTICVGFKYCRARSSVWTSGTASVVARGSAGSSISRAAVIQDVQPSFYNNSTDNLAAGAAFTGQAEPTLGISAIRVSFISDQPCHVDVQQSPDGVNWDIHDGADFFTAEGDSRTFQATASYFRVVVTNIGGAATTYLRLQTGLCPIAEALPRALTPQGKLRLSSSTDGYAPAPYNHVDREADRALLLDAGRNLSTRSHVLTDEASFRDDFPGSAIYSTLTGSVFFTNGSRVVTGVGTAFFGELSADDYIKRDADGHTAWALIGEVLSDKYLLLDEPYEGTTGDGDGNRSLWAYQIDTGCAITQTGSEILVASGTTEDAEVGARRLGDYLPFVLEFKGSISQRIANQIGHVGFSDSETSPDSEALIIFDGTDDSLVTLRTSFSGDDVEDTQVKMPAGATTDEDNIYRLEVLAGAVHLFINSVRVARHTLHIPGPYAYMDLHLDIQNDGIPASSTTLAVDTIYFANFNRVQVATESIGSGLAVEGIKDGLPVTIQFGNPNGELSLPKIINLNYSKSDGATVAGSYKRVQSYTVPPGYHGYILKFVSYQSEVATSRFASVITLGTLDIITNVFTGGDSYLEPQFTTIVSAEVTQQIGSASDVDITVTYTNELGVSGRTGTMSFTKNSAVGTRVLLTLQAGDLGVRSVQAMSTSPTSSSGAIKLMGFIQLAYHQDQSTSAQTETLFGPGALTFPAGTELVIEYNGGVVSKQRNFDILVQLVES